MARPHRLASALPATFAALALALGTLTVTPARAADAANMLRVGFVSITGNRAYDGFRLPNYFSH